MIKIWKKSSGKLLKTLKSHTEYINSIVFSPCGNFIASGSNDKTIKIWSKFTGMVFQTLISHTDSVQSVVFSHDGRFLASGSCDHSIKIWKKSFLNEFSTNETNLKPTNMNYVHFMTISARKTDFSCCNALFLNIKGLSDLNREFLLQKKAIFY